MEFPRKQLLVVGDRVLITPEDGDDRTRVGLYLPPMVWGIQYKYSEDAVLLVLASDKYDPASYIRDYSEFLELVK